MQAVHNGYGTAAAAVKLDIKDVWSAVEQYMQVTHDQIDGVQQLSNRRWDVTLQPQARNVYNRVKIEYMDRELTTSTGKLVKIVDHLENIPRSRSARCRCIGISNEFQLYLASMAL